MLARAAPAAIALWVLYFFRISCTGMLGPDEPRYAAIGREMAQSGDWITPRLWGEPWFEKPPLNYWMTAAAFRLGFNEDLAPRLPVALISVGFLAFFWRMMAREFGGRAGAASAMVLGTSAGWVAFSQTGVTDLPMSACFAAAALCTLRPGRAWGMAAGALLGLAVLAKGLVPLVLALPVIWYGRKRISPAALAAFAVVAVPWYALVWMRNGAAFADEFFWKHHFSRFSSGRLMHVQPFWYYLPVLLAGLFPWTPLLAGLRWKRIAADWRCRMFAAWAAVGLIFFSAAANKLPGYALPLLPPLAALIGIAVAERINAWLAAACAALLAVVPLVAKILPVALAAGLSRGSLPSVSWVVAVPLALAALVWWLAASRRQALAAVAAGAAAGVALIKIAAYPSIDAAASARPLWRQIASRQDQVCVETIHRNWRYGLNYYSLAPLPGCRDNEKPLHIRQNGNRPPQVW